jgi:hypothetical protein
LRQFVQANRPSASDYDLSIEEKLRQLRTRVDATRQEMNMPAATWNQPKAPPEVPEDRLVAATGSTKDTVDSSFTPVRREYLARLQAGEPATQLVAFLRSQGITDRPFLASVVQQAAYRRKNPDVPVEQYDTSAIDHRSEEMGAFNTALNRAGQSALGAGVAAAGNAVTGGYLPDIVGATGGNEEQARLALGMSAKDHPYASLAGGIVGGTTAALGGEAALAKMGMGAGVGRSLLADSSYGALAGSGSTPENRLSGATWGLAAGAGGSLIGQGLTRGGSAVLRGVSSPDVNRLASNGVNELTPGMMLSQSGTAGRAVKGFEDALTSLPGVGDMISARRMGGIRQFNSRAFDRALEPIGARVGDAVGEEAVARAQQLVKDAFGEALKGKQVTPDQAFVQAARRPLEKLAKIKRENLGVEIVGQIEDATQDLFDPATGALSGENMQTFLEALRQIKQSYKSDPLFPRVIKPSIDGISTAVEGMFGRQAPDVMPKFNAAKAAYRRLSVMADAVGRGSNTDGIFMPSQLGQAAKANAKKFDGAINAATDSRPFFDFQRAGQNVLPSQLPDSGSAKRLATIAGVSALPGAGAGLGYLGGGDPATGAGAGLGVMGVLALAYTKTGQQRIAKILMSRSPRAREIAEELRKRSAIAGAGSTALLVGPPE